VARGASEGGGRVPAVMSRPGCRVLHHRQAVFRREVRRHDTDGRGGRIETNPETVDSSGDRLPPPQQLTSQDQFWIGKAGIASRASLYWFLRDEPMCGALDVGEGHPVYGLGICRGHLRQTYSLVPAQCSVGYVQRDGFGQAMAQHGQGRKPVEGGVASNPRREEFTRDRWQCNG